MPTYDYRCEACGHELEVFQSMSEAPKRKCPRCKKSKLRRKIGGGAGFLFKGSGFYLTDYRSDSYKKGAEAEGKKADGGGETKPAASDGKTPKKPAPEKKSEKKKGKESAA